MLHRYRAAFDIKPPLQIFRHPYKDKEQEKMSNKIPFSQFLTESPSTHTVSNNHFFNILPHYLKNMNTKNKL